MAARSLTVGTVRPDRWRLRDWCFMARARDRAVLVDLFASRPDEARVAFDRCVAPLRALGVAELLDGDRGLDAGLSLVHTPGSQSLLVRSGDDAVLLWGTACGSPRPTFPSRSGP